MPEGASIDNGSNFVSAFGAGNIGMSGTGNFAIAGYTADFPDLNFGVFRIPGKDGGAASFGGGDVIAIASGSEHVEEAWRFIEWTMSDEPQSRFTPPTVRFRSASSWSTTPTSRATSAK